MRTGTMHPLDSTLRLPHGVGATPVPLPHTCHTWSLERWSVDCLLPWWSVLEHGGLYLPDIKRRALEPRYSHYGSVRADAGAIGPILHRLGLSSYLLDLTSSQAVVMGWAPLVSASFLFIWACNWVGAIIPWSFIEIPSGELAAPTNDRLRWDVGRGGRLVHRRELLLPSWLSEHPTDIPSLASSSTRAAILAST